jgi:hypothetical protein
MGLSLAFASGAILKSESRGTHDHILLSQIRDSPRLVMAAGPPYSFGTNHTENTASHSSFIVACVSFAAIRWRLLSPCLAMGVFAKPFHISCCLCCLHNYGFKQIRHYILGHHIMLNRLSNIHFPLLKLLWGIRFTSFKFLATVRQA